MAHHSPTPGPDGTAVTVVYAGAGTGEDGDRPTWKRLADRIDWLTVRDVPTAGEATEALTRGGVDAVVTELVLPDGSGLDLLESVRARFGDLPVVVLARDGDEAAASRAVSAGVTEYVRAEVDGRDTEETVRRLAAAVDRAVGHTGHDGALGVVERVTDAVLSVDEEWRFTFVDERAEDLLGLTAEGMLGEVVWDLFPDLAESTFGETYREVMYNREPRTVEEYYEPLSGWFEANAYPDDGGGLSVYFREVTDRREREQTLTRLVQVVSDADRSFEERLTDLLELGQDLLGLPFGFLTRIDRDGEVQTVVEARGDHELLQPGEQADLSESYCRKTIATDGALSVESALDEGWQGDPAYETFELGCYIGANVTLGDELYGTLCFAGPADMSVEFSEFDRSFVELVSQWTSAEYSREQSERDLKRQNQRLERFASVVSHDLRNPLNVVELSLELARESGDPEEFDRAQRAVDRMNELIDNLLALARSGERVDDLETVSVAGLVEECTATVQTGDATVELAGEFAVRADPSRLQQLLDNLVRNAIEHAGPAVTVTVGELDDGSGFYVEDDGPGIPEADRDQVFEAGYTTSDDGTGFGLSIVEDIATAHDWSVSVTAGTEGGARFEFRSVEFGWR